MKNMKKKWAVVGALHLPVYRGKIISTHRTKRLAEKKAGPGYGVSFLVMTSKEAMSENPPQLTYARNPLDKMVG